MLTDGHDPDGFDQRVSRVPSVDHQSRLSKRALSHCSPVRVIDFHSKLLLSEIQVFQLFPLEERWSGRLTEVNQIASVFIMLANALKLKFLLA